MSGPDCAIHGYPSGWCAREVDGPAQTTLFAYLGSCVTKDGSEMTDVNANSSKVRAAYVGMKHLRCQHDISLKLRGVHCAVVRSVLLCGCKTEYACRIRLKCTVRTGWSDCVNNVQLKSAVLGLLFEGSLSQRMKPNELRWLVARGERSSAILSYFPFLPQNGRYMEINR